MFESRALRWTSPKTIRTLNQSFVPLAYPGMGPKNGQYVMTPLGETIADEYGVDETLSKGLAAWRALPPERKTGDPAGLKPTADLPEPPAPPDGGIILKVYMRGLQRSPSGGVSRPEKMTISRSYTWAADPQVDHLWLTKAEWQALVPADPKPGQTVPLPEAVVKRVVTFHLLDKGLGLPDFFWTDASGEMTLTVAEVTPATIRMTLDGSAALRHDRLPPPAYPVAFFGKLEYDRAKGAFTRFDVLALGQENGDRRTEAQRKERLEVSYVVKQGNEPVQAVAFGLADPVPTINRVPPYALMYDSAKNYRRPYFGK